MPNYDGLSPEEKRRQQAAHEKIAGDFKRATRGQTRAPKAPGGPFGGKAVQIQLTIDGTLRLVSPPSERMRVEIAQKQADRLAAMQHAKVDRANKKGALVKEFAKAARNPRGPHGPGGHPKGAPERER